MPFGFRCKKAQASTKQELVEPRLITAVAAVSDEHPVSPSGTRLLGRTARTERQRPAALDENKLAEPNAESAAATAANGGRPKPEERRGHRSKSQSRKEGTAAAKEGKAKPAIGSSSGLKFQIRLSRKGGEILGLRLAVVSDPPAWEVMSVEPGMIQRWNEEHPDQLISVGDFIYSVNGKNTLEGMEVAFAEELSLELNMWRPRTSNVISL